MSRYLYKKIQNISPELLNFQHSGLKLTTLWSDPNVVNLASIVHTLIGTARVSDYLHFFCKVYKYWNLHSGILWSSHKYLSPPIHHLIFLQGSTGFTAFLGNSYIFPFFCSKYPSLIT